MYGEDVNKMANISNTQYFKVNADPEYRVKEILDTVYDAMAEKGYNPVNQIVGYIMSGDPTYITSYKNARYPHQIPPAIPERLCRTDRK